MVTRDWDHAFGSSIRMRIAADGNRREIMVHTSGDEDPNGVEPTNIHRISNIRKA
jgi:hypothetical protein